MTMVLERQKPIRLNSRIRALQELDTKLQNLK